MSIIETHLSTDNNFPIRSNTSNCLHISGLPFETNEEDILLFLKEYKVNSVKVLK